MALRMRVTWLMRLKITALDTARKYGANYIANGERLFAYFSTVSGDGLLNWTEPAEVLWRKIRAFTPWPGAFTFHKEQEGRKLLKIWDAIPCVDSGVPGIVTKADKTGIMVGCGQGSLQIQVLQREGGKRLSAAQFITGHPFSEGEHLG